MFDHLHLVSLAFSWGDFRAEWILQSLQFRLLFLINVAPRTAIYAFHELSISSPRCLTFLPLPPNSMRGRGRKTHWRGREAAVEVSELSARSQMTPPALPRNPSPRTEPRPQHCLVWNPRTNSLRLTPTVSHWEDEDNDG